ncbi:hypothetical protein M7806_24470, partial [Enterobacter hormaechei subsp. xiangfangensis]
KPTCRQNRCCKNGSDHRFRFPSGPQLTKARKLSDNQKKRAAEKEAALQKEEEKNKVQKSSWLISSRWRSSRSLTLWRLQENHQSS